MVSNFQNADIWATAWDLAAFSFRYPDADAARVVMSGEWSIAAREILESLGTDIPMEIDAAYPIDGFKEHVAAGSNSDDSADEESQRLLRELRADATRLFIGSPTPVCSPYEGVWRAEDDGVMPLLMVNPHSMQVERFCRACGLGRPREINQPIDDASTECGVLDYLASLYASEEAPDGLRISFDDFPGGSPRAAYEAFLSDHVLVWMPRFARKVMEEARSGFYVAAAAYLSALLARAARND